MQPILYGHKVCKSLIFLNTLGYNQFIGEEKIIIFTEMERLDTIYHGGMVGENDSSF